MTRRGVVSIHDYPEHLNPFREDEDVREAVERKWSRKGISSPRHESQGRREQQTPPKRPPPPSATRDKRMVAASPRDDEDKRIRQEASSVTTTPKSKPKTGTIKKKRPAPKPPSPSNSQQQQQEQLGTTVPNGDSESAVSTKKIATGGECTDERQDGEREQSPSTESDRGEKKGDAPASAPLPEAPPGEEPTPPPRRRAVDEDAGKKGRAEVPDTVEVNAGDVETGREVCNGVAGVTEGNARRGDVEGESNDSHEFRQAGVGTTQVKAGGDEVEVCHEVPEGGEGAKERISGDDDVTTGSSDFGHEIQRGGDVPKEGSDGDDDVGNDKAKDATGCDMEGATGSEGASEDASAGLAQRATGSSGEVAESCREADGPSKKGEQPASIGSAEGKEGDMTEEKGAVPAAGEATKTPSHSREGNTGEDDVPVNGEK